jgi:hypothetical protein
MAVHAPTPRLPAALAAVAVAVVATAAGVGWLYLLRDAQALRVGPALPDALALERLAGADAQPVLRVLAAFVPAGVVAGIAVRRLTRSGAAGRALLAGGPAYVLLMAIGLASDAITHSEPAGRYVAAQPLRAAVWLPALIVALCSASAPGMGRR